MNNEKITYTPSGKDYSTEKAGWKRISFDIPFQFWGLPWPGASALLPIRHLWDIWEQTPLQQTLLPQ